MLRRKVVYRFEIAWAAEPKEPGDFIFKIATAEHLLSDIADMACDGQVAFQK